MMYSIILVFVIYGNRITVSFKFRRENMWINTDIAEPSYDNQIVKVKVSDFLVII